MHRIYIHAESDAFLLEGHVPCGSHATKKLPDGTVLIALTCTDPQLTRHVLEWDVRVKNEYISVLPTVTSEDEVHPHIKEQAHHHVKGHAAHDKLKKHERHTTKEILTALHEHHPEPFFMPHHVH